MGVIVIRTRYDEGTESAEVATSVFGTCSCLDYRYDPARLTLQNNVLFNQYQLII